MQKCANERSEIDFYLDCAVLVPVRIRRIWKRIMFIKIQLNKNRSFSIVFAQFRRECRSAQMNTLRIYFYFGMPYPFHFEFVEFGSRVMFIKV